MAPSTDLVSIIINKANKYAVDVKFMLTMAFIESAFNPKAKNPSGAAGLYQFMPSTAKQYKLINPYNPQEAADAAARLATDNAKYLAQHDIAPSGAYLYLAHQQGMGGAVAIIRAAQTKRGVSATIRRNMDANGGRGKTPEGFLAHWKDLYASKAKQALELANPALQSLHITVDE
jgi:hypothetical protein